MTAEELESFQLRYNDIINGLPDLKRNRLDILKRDLEDAYGIDVMQTRDMDWFQIHQPEVWALYMDVIEERRG